MTNTVSKKMLAITTVLAFSAGAALMWFMALPSGEHDMKESAKADEPLYWVAPMDANYRRDEPGKSPMGMELVPVYKEANDDPAGTVTISPNVETSLGVQLGEASRGDLSLIINTVGFIQFNEEKVNHFHSRVEGWIESLALTSVGDPVEKGQKLFRLYSPELVNAQEEYLAALTSNNRALAKGSLKKLDALGVSDEQVKLLNKTRKVEQSLPFYAQSSGVVATLNVREGSFIKPATQVLSVGALDDVWVIAEIFERQAAWVKPGQRVRMTIEGHPGEEWLGVVDYLYPVLDPQTRTLRARIVFDNAGQRLKPNMFAQLSIDAGVKMDALSVPRQAIIRQGGITRLVKTTGGGKFRSVRIKTGIESGDRVEVTAGLDLGDRVVISGQFLIDSESSVSADLRRIDGGMQETKKETPSRVCVNGTLVNLMRDHRMASVRHAPVPEWDWPGMTMDFTFTEEVDLSAYGNGDEVRFCVDKLSDGSYEISQMEAGQAGGKP